MKSKISIFNTKKTKEDLMQESKLDSGIIEKCSNFSSTLRKLSNKLVDIDGSKEQINNEISWFKQLDEDTLTNLLEYFEYLILNKRQNEFIVPYYAISNMMDQSIHEGIALHEHTQFGLLGEVNDILQ